ncbi:MAG: 50S ribosomal protein L24 [Actinobacteria bacterium]|nr:50S ribosomal protein L24 [Actinomycetota bacterium]
MAGLKIKAGDRVQVLTGKERGKQGTVARVIPSTRKVVVEGVNSAKKHAKARSAEKPGGIISIDMPLPVANVGIICSKCGPTRVGYAIDGGEKRRICRKCGGDL